jgi:uncharacterized repeat protein (TIGR03803 family)
MGTMKQMRLAVACALAVITVAPVEAQVQEIVLHNFEKGTGWDSVAGVTLAPDGIYGTTYEGGTADVGVVYKLDKSFNYTVLHNFTGPDGSTPGAGVIRDLAGNLYGTAPLGGTAGHGVVFELDSAGNYAVLYNFTGGADGGNPYTGVIRDSAGNLYGTASNGGTAGYGVVFELDAAGNYTVLHNFTVGADGSRPDGVVRDSAGNLYGTTSMGGGYDAGVVYKLDADGNYIVLHRFTENFANPNGVLPAPDGGLYGTTQGGGTAGYGSVYKLDNAGNYTVLYNFTGGTDGEYPLSGVIRDSGGNLYGTTDYGGTGNAGVVYKLDSAGNYTVLYNFKGRLDGGNPRAGVVLGPAGHLTGTTYTGGNSGGGVVFALTGVQ